MLDPVRSEQTVVQLQLRVSPPGGSRARLSNEGTVVTFPQGVSGSFDSSEVTGTLTFDLNSSGDAEGLQTCFT